MPKIHLSIVWLLALLVVAVSGTAFVLRNNGILKQLKYQTGQVGGKLRKATSERKQLSSFDTVAVDAARSKATNLRSLLLDERATVDLKTELKSWWRISDDHTVEKNIEYVDQTLTLEKTGLLIAEYPTLQREILKLNGRRGMRIRSVEITSSHDAQRPVFARASVVLDVFTRLPEKSVSSD